MSLKFKPEDFITDFDSDGETAAELAQAKFDEWAAKNLPKATDLKELRRKLNNENESN